MKCGANGKTAKANVCGPIFANFSSMGLWAMTMKAAMNTRVEARKKEINKAPRFAWRAFSSPPFSWKAGSE